MSAFAIERGRAADLEPAPSPGPTAAVEPAAPAAAQPGNAFGPTGGPGAIWSSPRPEQRTPGPFAYAGVERDADGDARGFSAGLGLVSGELSPGASGELHSARLHAGSWRDGDQTVSGISGGGQLAGAAVERGAFAPVGFDVNLGSASAEATVGQESAALGLGASAVDGSASIGTDEHNVRLGAGMGGGAGVRVHYGDADGDGILESGFGFDLGPVSFDVRTEAFGHAGDWIGDRVWEAINGEDRAVPVTDESSPFHGWSVVPDQDPLAFLPAGPIREQARRALAED